MPKGIEEHSGNPLAKEVMSDQEVTEFAGTGRKSAKIRKKLSQYDQVFAQDPVKIKKCKECGQIYSYPVNNSWAAQKLGPDQGLCHECSGAYDDPEGFIQMG